MRERRFPPRVSLSNAPDSSHPFSSCGGVPPTPLWGSNFQSKRRRRFRSRVGEMNAAQTAAQQHAQTANDALVYVRTVKLRFSGDQSHVYEAFLDIMRDFKSGRYVPLSRDSPSFAKIPSDHICTLCFSFLERKRQIRHDRRRQTRQKAPQRPRGLARWVQLLLTRRE